MTVNISLKMKNIPVIFILLLLLQSCMPEPQNENLSYQNIIILSDMSDRVEPFINGNVPNQQYPPKDTIEISKILSFFRNECVKPGKKIGDKSSVYFFTFSDEENASIDIREIRNLSEKQQFINSTGKYQNNGLDYEIKEFKKKVRYAYNHIRNKGLDLISILNEKIENKSLVKKNTILTNGIDTTFISYDNHIYIFTDGYLEYYGKKNNSQFYFGEVEINKIRAYCKKNNVDIKTAIQNNSSLCLTPIKNSKNKEINLHIVETAERDKNNKLQTYKYPLGLRDNEILEAVWKKWALESGFKSFEWKRY